MLVNTIYSKKHKGWPGSEGLEAKYPQRGEMEPLKLLGGGGQFEPPAEKTLELLDAKP